MTKVKAFLRDTAGSTAVEYGMLITFISLAIVAALTLVGSKISGKLTYLANTFT